jgi:hypothetical protein
MNEVILPFICHFVLVFFNNILIYNESWEDHLQHVRLVLTKLQEHQLFVKRSKCVFGEHKVAYLGRIILPDGVTMDQLNVHAVPKWPVPWSIYVVQAFLGLVGYYHQFIWDYSAITTPLTRLLQKGALQWGAEDENAFHALQQVLTSAPGAPTG